MFFPVPNALVAAVWLLPGFAAVLASAMYGDVLRSRTSNLGGVWTSIETRQVNVGQVDVRPTQIPLSSHQSGGTTRAPNAGTGAPFNARTRVDVRYANASVSVMNDAGGAERRQCQLCLN